MTSKLTRFTVLAAILTLATLGCAKQAPLAVAPPSAPTVKVEPKVETPARGYSVDLVDGWKLVEESEMEGDEPQRIAEYENEVSETLHVATYVTAFKIDGTAAEFYEGMKAAANGRDEKNVKVIGQRMSRHGEHEGYEVLEARRVPGGVALILSVCVTDGKMGYYVTCGGNIKYGDEVLATCKPFIKSFRIGK